MNRVAIMAALLAVPAAAQAVPADLAQDKLLTEGLLLIRAQQPQQAIERFDRIIAFYDQRHARETRRIYCARTPTEALLYMTEAAAAKQASVALDATWSDAIFFKGFALIDLDQREAAAPLIARALTLSPRNSQYLSEAAELRKAARDWPGAYALFERAKDAAIVTDNSNPLTLGRAWRGMGFTLIEMGRLDEAEAMFGEALKLDPNDRVAKGELAYIAKLRAKTPGT